MSNETATEHPNLSRLSREDRLRISVAETQGYRWGNEGPFWRMSAPGGGTLARLSAPRGDDLVVFGLPDYLTDPAAWGALMERERIEVCPGPRSARTRWVARAVDCEGEAGCYVSHYSPGWAVCLAVLAKHGRDISEFAEAV